MTEKTNLKDRLQQKTILVAPGVADAMTALVATQAGAEAIYLSGANIAYSRLGRPDIGLVSLTEVESTLSLVRERVDVPIIVDADTGYGNALNVARTTKRLERAGASAIQFEDQVFPKRCGHLKGKELVSAEEMCGKIAAALDARASSNTLIVGRTDAIAVEGLDAALDRAERYLDVGCDVLFIEAPESVEHMRVLTGRFGGRVPLLANMVEGGATPSMTSGALEQVGFDLVIFPGGIMRALTHTMRRYYASLAASGSNGPFRDEMLTFSELQGLLGTDEMIRLGKTYEPSAAPS